MTIFPHIAHYRILKPSEPHFRGSFLFLYGGLWSGYGAPLYDVVRMTSLTPAEMLGIGTRTGSIQVGKAADLLVFDEDVQLKHIVVAGRTEFSTLQ